MSQPEVLELISDADEFFYKAPVSDADRFDQLYDMVEMMMADGKVEESENILSMWLKKWACVRQ